MRPPSRYQASGVDVVLGDDPAAGHRPRLPLDGDDPVHQHQRLVGQADAGREAVRLGKLGAEHAGDRAAGEFQAHVAVEGDFLRTLPLGRGHSTSPCRSGSAPGRAVGGCGDLHSLQRLPAERVPSARACAMDRVEPVAEAQIGLVGLQLRLLGGGELPEQRVRQAARAPDGRAVPSPARSWVRRAFPAVKRQSSLFRMQGELQACCVRPGGRAETASRRP